MATPEISKEPTKTQKLVQTLDKEKSWNGEYRYQLQGFWFPSTAIEGMIRFQLYFQPQDTDIILVSTPKSGTTWLMALAFAIVNRTRCPLSDSPLLTSNPHTLVPNLELDLYKNSDSPNLQHLPRPRIFSTHAPYALLPSSIKDSNWPLVYICRNPLDQVISYWHFLQKLRPENQDPVSIDEAFDMFCNGFAGFGPFWDHALGYWNKSLETPEKVLFLKYEDLKQDIMFHMKRLAAFLGFPFSKEEERGGVLEEISRLCSFQTLKDLEVNKKGRQNFGLPNEAFFRKGEVGDWANYLTPPMVERIRNLMEDKWRGSGLTFELPSPHLA